MAMEFKKPSEGIIQSVLELYERGRSVDALHCAETFAPIKEWAGVEACILAARIAANTGAPRLSSRLTVRAWRTDREHPAAQLDFGLELSTRRGPLALWLAMRDWPQPRNATLGEQAELLALQSNTAVDLRDFVNAEELLSRAISLGTGQPWVHLQRSHLLEGLDRIEEALEAAKSASALYPHAFYRPGVQSQARFLQLLDRDDEAIQLLSEAGAFLQNGPVMAQLFSILAENGRWQEAEVALERCAALLPLAEPQIKRWIISQQARVAYQLGKRAEAARFAGMVDDAFHKNFCQKLGAVLGAVPEQPERVHLDVTFVRQHFKTCAPATLAALGRYWGVPSEHAKLVEGMCYDGTPHWQQRQWAEKNGWFVREFRVTQESTVALLSRKIPFAISIVESTFAHMMAVVGFDRTRQTLLLRDPGQPYIQEFSDAEFLTRYRPFGPHGMVFLPADQQAQMDGVSLPDCDAYDQYHQFWLAVVEHDRKRAAEILSEMETRFPDHQLVWETRLDLAVYDTNNAEQAKCLDKLLDLYPNNPPRLLRRLACLRDAPREERIRFLEHACKIKDADPALFVELARALEDDARRSADARHWLKRAFRFRPMDPVAIAVRADLNWEDGRLEEATDLYRFAANLDGFREGWYQSWFLACRKTRRTNEALSHLQDRVARFGHRSEQPAITLAWALREMEQPARACEVLAEARRLRPEDGVLLLRSASLASRLGQMAEAERLFDNARGKVRENDWLRTTVEIAENRLDTAVALQRSRELLKLEPLALDMHGCVARTLSRLEGNAAALAHLKSACAAFPHHYGLQRVLVDWSHNKDAATVEIAARDLLRVAPTDAWARRELAVALSNLKRDEEALCEATEAAHIEPRNSYSFSILGHIYQRLQKLPQAREQFRRAVELNVDNSVAIHALFDLARTDKERRDELAFIEHELIQQVVQGDGLLAFLELARPLIEPEQLLTNMRMAQAERPDLWYAWSALISQLGYLGRLDEARDLALEAAKKFPHLPRTWLDLSNVYQWRKEPEKETQAAEHAFEMNPAWNRSTLALTGVLERRTMMEEARRVYERALQHASDDAQLHANYAHLLWRQRQKDQAFAAIERALRLEFGFERGWGLLVDWSNDCGEPQRAGAFARTLTLERPGEPRVWIVLARALDGPSTMPERLAAVEKALELDRSSVDAWDLKADLLTSAERFDDAIKACNEGAAACTLGVHILHGRKAWIEAQRRQLPEAIRLMRLVLAENASYVWGWNQLAQWLMQQEAIKDATTAVEQLLRLRPRDPLVHRQLGFLRLRQKDHPGAQRAFATALQLAPTDANAGHNIFDLQLQSGDLDGARATLRVMETHQPGASTVAAAIRLHLRKNELALALKSLETLCLSPDPDPWPLNAATDAFKNAKRSGKALKILRRSLKKESCNPEVGVAAIRLLLSQRKDLSAVLQFLRFKPGEIQRRAAPPLVQGLVPLKSALLLRWLLWRRREVLEKDDAAWGQVGYALSTFNRMEQVVDWLSGWRTRQEVQPWMLFNLCLAYRQRGRYEEATSLAHYALEKWGHREGSADLRLFLAVEDALAGDFPKAAQNLKQVVIREAVPYDHDLLALAKALVEFHTHSLSERPNEFKAVRRSLGQHFSNWRLLQVSKDVRRTFRRSKNVFIREGAGWRAHLWFGWKLNWQWLLLPVSPVLLAIAPPAPYFGHAPFLALETQSPLIH